MQDCKPLEGDEVVIEVPKGHAHKVRLRETDEERPSELTIRVSKNRTKKGVPVLGVIVK